MKNNLWLLDFSVFQKQVKKQSKVFAKFLIERNDS